MKKLFFLTLATGLSIHCLAQFSISGVVKDSASNTIVGATVRVADTYKGVFTDNNGAYQLANLKQGDYLVEVSYLGYKTQQYAIENLSEDVVVNFDMEKSEVSLGEFIVSGTRVEENAPFTHTNITQEDFEKNNLGQDIPILLQNSVSMVSTSDAGAGVGYTGFRLRGSDATRINVTVNGVPINDAESQGVFWVNMPDFASSTESIQIQRGVGSSTNGAGAFGGSVNLETTALKEKAYGEISSSYGSFNTHKETIKFGTGLIDNRWAFDGRASNVQSDGYIDRATSDLKSYYLSGAYYGKKLSIKGLTFAGKEKTYQSWYGTPEQKLTGNKKDVETYIEENGWLSAAQVYNLTNSGRSYNYYEYENETDNYQQDNYQLHFSYQFNEKLNATMAVHYTYGRGYYEQFKNQSSFSDYGLNNLVIATDTITTTDLIRRRWLDNHFYGTTYNLNYNNNKLKITVGGAFNRYDGDHYGEIIWAEYANGSDIRDRYYDNNGLKTDFNSYLKATYSLTEKTSLFADLQVRTIDYVAKGIDNNLATITVDTTFMFFNPKAGISHTFSNKVSAYTSVAVGNKEPSRNDFIDNTKANQPQHESLIDYELGASFVLKKVRIKTNLYYMDYHNQLILTGALNDVGSNIRTNVSKSYRSGIELETNILVHKKITLNANGTFSQNKITNFTAPGFPDIEHQNTDIAFSPNIIAAASVEYKPLKRLILMVQTKYVGQQFLDNTSNLERKIEAYQTVDTRISYTVFPKRMKEITFNLLVNNIFNTLYSSNGYVYYGNYYYPQAGTNFLAGVTMKF